MSTTEVVFVRHGESEWNKDNRFCGWVDIPLSHLGCEEAKAAGKMLEMAGYSQFDIVYTSFLSRASDTANLIIDQLVKDNDPNTTRTKPNLVKDWRLNERHYGGLTGFNKAEVAALHGLNRVMEWRRGYDVPPPPLTKDNPFYDQIGNHSL